MSSPCTNSEGELPIYCKRTRILIPGNLAVLSRKVLLEDWCDVYAVEEIDEKVKVFTSTMLTIMDETIPERTVRMHPSDKPWMTSFIKTKIKARLRAFSRNDLEQYEQLRVIVSKCLITNLMQEVFVRQTQLNGLSLSSHSYRNS